MYITVSIEFSSINLESFILIFRSTGVYDYWITCTFNSLIVSSWQTCILYNTSCFNIYMLMFGNFTSCEIKLSANAPPPPGHRNELSYITRDTK